MYYFLGGVNYTEMPQIYNASDVFVLPSLPTLLWEEQLGYSILEAMAAGRPVIASDLPALREVVNPQAGLLFPAGNYLELKECFSRLLDDPSLRKRMGICGQEHVRTQFDARITAARYAKIYESLSD